MCTSSSGTIKAEKGNDNKLNQSSASSTKTLRRLLLFVKKSKKVLVSYTAI